MDLHIHDVDMVRFLFGEPESVSAVTYDDVTKWQVVNSRFYYPDKMIVATGTWDEANTVKFKAEFRVRFETASVILENNQGHGLPRPGIPFRCAPKIRQPHGGRTACARHVNSRRKLRQYL
jgi:predicted dehydrogenase